MTKLIVDGKEIDVPPEYTLLQACEAAGAEIPRFCFHEPPSIPGNCRMCLFDLKGSVKPSMARCLPSARCIRFAAEVAGVPELGAIGRGEDMEITTYLEQAMTSELQGNVVDLCPVGALTNKPYAFAARPWELNKTESIDVMDAVGSAIRIDTRGREVMRILPRVNDDVNEEWISDKTRHVVDGLRTQRLDQPYISENGQLHPASWRDAFEAIAAKIKQTEATHRRDRRRS